MAKQRTKSYQQIMAQARRMREDIERQAKRDGWTPELDDRHEKIYAIEDRYLTNIRDQKIDQRDTDLYNNAWDKGNIEKAHRIANRNGKRQWARSTYMGLSNK